ncbi:hypothetical protein BGZ95_010872 [Linnemannia exigua]|uniref:P-loop containing nucleoside triphosphate hydrolase protein n=1 Tax=Linnemannia exigua TaxID=604196 RepID=A0AAD4DAX0_9FUNG|nr:hypothetical protein BGZ95_010872 [Linnemannia exigua]
MHVFCFSSNKQGPLNEKGISLVPCFLNTVILGAPALLASIAFLVRGAYLKRHGHAHGLGHILVYWPQQLAVVVAVGALIAHLWTFFENSVSTSFAFGSLLVAWVLAIRLNRLESIFEIRSSNTLFFFELYFVLATFVSLYSLHHNDNDDTNSDHSLRYLHAYFYAICVIFILEALPRGSTRVQRQSNASQHDKANLFSQLTFHYMQSIISLGYKQPLTMDDINILPKEAETRHGFSQLNSQWEDRKKAVQAANLSNDAEHQQSPSLIRVIGRTFFKPLARMVSIQLTAASLQFLLPVLIQQIMIFIESENNELPKERGVILALGMLTVSITVFLLKNYVLKKESELGLEIRNALVSMIYRKALVLSPGSRKSSSTGAITNHMSNDAEKWTKEIFWVIGWINVPFEILVATAMLYNIIGWSVFCGLAVIILITPTQSWVGEFFDKTRDDKAAAMDSRVALMTEVLSNIKTIKLYGYESGFKTKIESFRNKEIALLRKSGIVMSFLSIVFTCMPLFIAFVSFAVFATVGGPNFTPGVMNAQVVFVSLSLFGLLQYPIGSMSRVTESTVSLRVSTRRIQKFLLKEELDSSAVCRDPILPKDPKTPVIHIEDATFAWVSEDPSVAFKDDSDDEGEDEEDETTALLAADRAESSAPALVEINVAISRGQLTAVVGRVGQGKSSLLSAIIGDMYKRKGLVKVYGSVALVSQQAWICNATVRDNIVFGKAFDQEKYDRILFASGLLPDLEILAAGDMTEIGERGINLSGGQKQRVSLARAAYQDADVYLMDDPLSAVDAHVDQHLWEHLIGPKGLLKDKTRLLVTHGIHHLEHVDHILVVKDGRISEAGHYEHLIAAKNAFYQLIKDFSVSHRKKNRKATSPGVTIADAVREASISSAGSDEDETGTVVAAQEDDKKDNEEADGELVKDEEAHSGIVGWDTFIVYCEAMSWELFVAVLLVFVLWEAFQLSVPLWLEHWTSVMDTTSHSVAYYLIIYGFLVLIYITIDVWLTYISNVVACVRASVILHENVLTRVLRLPMAFFDVTPQGRILNRFSSDIGDIDEMVPESFITLLTCISNFIGTLMILSFATPAFVFILPLVGLVYLILQNYYIRTSSMLRRLDSVTKSPMYQHFTESLNGLSSIRAMDLKDRFIDENAKRTDKSATASYASWMINRWLNVRLEALTASACFVAALLAVLNKDSITPSMAGLALSSTSTLAYNYSNKRTEAPASTGIRLPERWPQQGRIIFKNYSTRYREGLDLVLKDVSFEVQPSEKVGIVGRTGAGKSSLTLALFRLVEAADSYWARASAQDDKSSFDVDAEELGLADSLDGGSIEIDGVDISTLGLNDLRQHLSIIPQDPTLFAGTVRENLDPLNELTDTDLWQALERAHLKTHIASLNGGLSFEVAQNGENFSVGQRSLICLARALLRKTKILVLDEATAAVDVETDELIQKTIRQEFHDRTILTIAHRIKTVMDSDKILVLEKGRVEEFDSPKRLMKAKNGLFYCLAHQAGEA